MRSDYNESGIKKVNMNMEIVHKWTWASDKICKTCYYYNCGFCDKDGKRTGQNDYCSYWRP